MTTYTYKHSISLLIYNTYYKNNNMYFSKDVGIFTSIKQRVDRLHYFAIMDNNNNYVRYSR